MRTKWGRKYSIAFVNIYGSYGYHIPQILLTKDKNFFLIPYSWKKKKKDANSKEETMPISHAEK